MVTISLCMIVKNEERVLARCLESICDLVDEIIIVDTGSQDKTKKIARRYTQKLYDFVWNGDFSEARNFAFSKASCDYIYSADADEVLDDENREKFRLLKENMDTGIEIVQMYYGNQLFQGTVYNYDRELRPKLFKRTRSFCWIEPVHETVRLLPVVFDSEIEITHLPESNHAGRDIGIFERITGEGKPLSERLVTMYAKELLIAGTKEELERAEGFFVQLAEEGAQSPEQMREALCVLTRAARLKKDPLMMYRYALKGVTDEGISEVCFELGEYYLGQKDYKEASVWYYNAAYETQSILNAQSGGELPLLRLADCYLALGEEEQAELYRQAAAAWKAEQS